MNPASTYGTQNPTFNQGAPISKVLLEGDLYSKTTPKGHKDIDQLQGGKRRRTENKRTSPLRVTKMSPVARGGTVSRFDSQLKLQVEPVERTTLNKVNERASSS